MPEVYYVAIKSTGTEIPNGYEAITLMALPDNQAHKKADLGARVQEELKSSSKGN